MADKDLANRFATFIKSEFKNQQEAGEFLNIDQTLVSRMALGKYGISNNVIMRLVVGKNMNSNWFFAGLPPMKHKVKIAVSEMSEIKAGIDNLRRHLDYFSKTQKSLLKKLEEQEQEIQSLKEDTARLKEELEKRIRE